MSAPERRRSAGGGRGPRKGAAERGARLRSAFFLSAVSVALCALGRFMLDRWGNALPELLKVLWQAFFSVGCFELPALLGLGVLDGDQSRLVPRRAVGAAQIRYLAMLGALLVAPMTLMADMLLGAQERLFGVSAATAAALPPAPALFLPLLLRSAVVAPLCEEHFFRGYLLGALGSMGGFGAVAVSALVFALAHGSNFAVYAVLGALLGAITLRTRSLFAPMIVHGVYNFTLIMLSFLGLDALMTGLSPLSCALRVALLAAFFATLKRLWALTPLRQDAVWSDGEGLTRRELACLLLALALVPALPAILEAMRG